MPTLSSISTLRAAPQLRVQVIRMVLLALAGSLFIAAAAQISVPLPFSPVPVTGQTLAVLLVGGVLGARAGFLAVLAYLGEGAMGLPVFAGGAGGAAMLAGATAGYLWAFPVAALIAGLLIDLRLGRLSVVSNVLALALADAVVFLGGVAWLARFLQVGAGRAVDLGLWPYVPGDLVKIVLVALAVPGGRLLLDVPGRMARR